MKNKIIKYLYNEISEQELRELKLWLRKPENQNEFKEFVREQALLNQAFTEVNVASAYRKLLVQINNEQEKGGKTLQLPAWLKYAAVFIGILGLGYGLFTQGFWKDKKLKEAPQITLQLEDGSIEVIEKVENGTVTTVQGNVILKQEKEKLVYTKTKNEENTPVIFNTLNIPFGKQFEVVLADGSRIILNAGSQLKYPTFFPEGKVRNVYLEGEAFFVVSEDAARPFVVHTKKMKIRVLGTKFNISSYKNEKTIAVLAAGKIAATPANKEYNKDEAVILSPGQMASLRKGKIQISEVNVEKYTAWVFGKLMFIDDSFAVIANKLERHYNIEIVNHCSKLKKTAFTGTFESEDVEKVLKTFQIHTPFSYKKENNKIIISGCAKRK